MTFDDLVRKVQRYGCKPGDPNAYTVKELAAMCGCSRTFLYYLMSGHKRPSDELVVRIAYAFDVPEATVWQALRKTQKAAA